MNTKITKSLKEHLIANGERGPQQATWHHFRFGAYRESNIYGLMLMRRQNSPVGRIRSDFLEFVLKPAAKLLDRQCRSNTFNLSGFYIHDERMTLEIFTGDWIPLVTEMEKILVNTDFLEKHEIEKLFWYNCVHSMQNTTDDLRSIFSEVCNINCPHIIMVQVHKATTVKADEGQVILTDYCDL